MKADMNFLPKLINYGRCPLKY